MPQRFPTSKPGIIAGTLLTSGDPVTGQIPYTLGGSRYAMRASGVVGPDVQLQVGGGRLDMVQIFANATPAAAPAASGIAVVFYETAAVISGGPINGEKILASIHPAGDQAQNQLIFNSGLGCLGKVVPLGVPYQSGLAVFVASGQVGWGATYTPVLSG